MPYTARTKRLLEVSDGEQAAVAAQALFKPTDFERDEGLRIVEREQQLLVFAADQGDIYILPCVQACTSHGDRELRLITAIRPANCDPARLQSVPQNGLVRLL